MQTGGIFILLQPRRFQLKPNLLNGGSFLTAVAEGLADAKLSNCEAPLAGRVPDQKAVSLPCHRSPRRARLTSSLACDT